MYIYVYLFNLCQAGSAGPHTTFVHSSGLKNTQKHVQSNTFDHI